MMDYPTKQKPMVKLASLLFAIGHSIKTIKQNKH